MPANKLLERLKKSIQKKQGIDTSKAFAIATSILEKNGYMKGGDLTQKGIIKSKLPEGTIGIPSVKKRLKSKLLKK